MKLGLRGGHNYGIQNQGKAERDLTNCETSAEKAVTLKKQYSTGR